MRNALFLFVIVTFFGVQPHAWAGVLEYGDADLFDGVFPVAYPSNPRTGATLEGLAPNVVTFGAPAVAHSFPFSPSGTDFPGTDQIFVGSVQTVFLDGYSSASSRLNGPQVLVLDYGPLVAPGATIQTLTLGIAADDFQFPDRRQPYTASINGAPNTALTALLNSLNLGGPSVRFFTIGVGLGDLLPSHVLTLSIDQGGGGGDGWAVDFLTAGVTVSQPSAIPEPASLILAMLGLGLLCATRRHVGRGSYCAQRPRPRQHNGQPNAPFLTV